MRKKNTEYEIGKYALVKKSTRGLVQGECIKIQKLVKKGNKSYFVIEHLSGSQSIVPSKYIKHRIITNFVDGKRVSNVIILIPGDGGIKPID